MNVPGEDSWNVGVEGDRKDFGVSRQNVDALKSF